MEIDADHYDALLRRIDDLEDLLSVYEARAENRNIPWSQVKTEAGLAP